MNKYVCLTVLIRNFNFFLWRFYFIFYNYVVYRLKFIGLGISSLISPFPILICGKLGKGTLCKASNITQLSGLNKKEDIT